MKLKNLIFVMLGCFIVMTFSGCDSNTVKAIELMGAGDRIHDSYTFANVGTKINDDGNNEYRIYGSVEKLTNQAVKEEFEIAEDVTHIVAIKLTAVEEKVVKDEVEISIDGVRNYDAEHLNASSHTFILLEAKPAMDVSISVKWNNDAEMKIYKIRFDDTLQLK